MPRGVDTGVVDGVEAAVDGVDEDSEEMEDSDGSGEISEFKESGKISSSSSSSSGCVVARLFLLRLDFIGVSYSFVDCLLFGISKGGITSPEAVVCGVVGCGAFGPLRKDVGVDVALVVGLRGLLPPSSTKFLRCRVLLSGDGVLVSAAICAVDSFGAL